MPDNGIRMRVLTDAEKETILDGLSEGKTLTGLAKVMGFKPSHLHKIISKGDPLFAKEVESARSLGIDVIFEGLLTVADEYENPLRARVKMECIGKYAGALRPDKYGDRHHITVSRLDMNEALTAADNRLIDVLIQPTKRLDSAAEPELIEVNKVNSNS